jgi:hypothetical protein
MLVTWSKITQTERKPMDKVTIPIATEDVLKGLVELPSDELERVIKTLERSLPPLRIKPVFVEAMRLDQLTGLISVGGDAVDDTENIYG